MSVLRTSLRTARAAHGVRFASTSTSSASTSAASTSAAGSTSASDEHTCLPMSWSEYFAMRRRRKTWANVTSVPSSAAGLLLGASYFANLEGDPTQPIMGIDPMIVYGGSTLACMLGGWLVGPTIGNALFSVTHPKLARGNPPPLEVMDREFYHRIKERRADPSRQSVTNPAPDFYGEKIVSIPTYRRWLKDQKAYDRKASHGVPGEEE